MGNEIAAVVGILILCLAAIELGQLRREVSICRLEITLLGEDVRKLVKELKKHA